MYRVQLLNFAKNKQKFVKLLENLDGIILKVENGKVTELELLITTSESF